MLQKNPTSGGQRDLFRARLDEMIDLRHELVRLAGLIDWGSLEASLEKYYALDKGRPGEPVRLMTGLLFLKDLKGLSDEDVCEVWRENPYFQYFCGEEFFQHRLPVEPPSLSIFRKRIGEEGMACLFGETIRLGLKTGVVSEQDVKRVTVDTTVQEKAIRFPTDTHLCDKARAELVKLAASRGVRLRQSYARKSKHAVFMANRYMAARQLNRGRKMIKTVRNYLGRVIRDIERAGAKDASVQEAFATVLERAQKIFAQAGNPKEPNKIYAWHAPEVECIAKGKAHKKYEFGCKVSIAATNRRNFIVGAKAHHGKPYDGHTLRGVLEHVEAVTGIKPEEAQVDLGYRGHGIEEEKDGCTVILARQKRGITPAKKRRQKRRNAIEPIIGHCKNDRAVGARNWLKGEIGDCINALAMAIGFNLRKILRHLAELLLQLFLLIIKSSNHPLHKPVF